MSKQVLDVYQMQHLQELGLELKETLLYWARCVDNNPRASTHYGKWVLIKGNSAQTVGLMHWEFISAYTLQDVLDALPQFVVKGLEYWLEIGKEDEENWYISYRDVDTKMQPSLFYVYKQELIDAAYEMLCWAIENKFVETNKNE